MKHNLKDYGEIFFKERFLRVTNQIIKLLHLILLTLLLKIVKIMDGNYQITDGDTFYF